MSKLCCISFIRELPILFLFFFCKCVFAAVENVSFNTSYSLASVEQKLLVTLQQAVNDELAYHHLKPDKI